MAITATVLAFISTASLFGATGAARNVAVSQAGSVSSPGSFATQLKNIAEELFHKPHLTVHAEENKPVDVADFSTLLAKALEFPSPKTTAPAGHTHWYYPYVSSLMGLFFWTHDRLVSANYDKLPIVPITRERAAAIAYSAAFQQSTFHNEVPPPQQFGSFVDESEISPGLRDACHAAVYQGLLSVELDSLFHPHRLLTWEEFIRMIQVIKEHQKTAIT